MKVFDELYRCVHCGFCLPTCPTYLATGLEGKSPRGRLHLMKAVVEGRAEAKGKLLEYLDSCVYCLRCETACPSGVRYGEVYEEFFKKYKNEMQSVSYRRVNLLFNLLNSKIGLRIAPYAKILSQELGSMVSGGDISDLVGKVYEAKGDFRGRVALFVSGDCVAWRYRRSIVEAALRVLTWNGYEVVVPRFACCGAPYRHSGQFEKAEALAQRNLSILKELRGVDAVVVPNSGGCQAELLRYLRGFKVIDAAQLLADGLRGVLGEVKIKLAVQHSCHLMNVAKAHDVVLKILSKIPGLVLAPLPSADVCCAGGNMYPLRHRKIADAVLAKKREEVLSLSPDGILAESPSCLQQLTKIGLPVYFPLEILDMSYARAENNGYPEIRARPLYG
ncbi:Fe-S oxidoreductase [Pyrobaculum oguniense TE7]|uniref:Fe-S oxidoreductase n=1 Tax=Pyrobaculum oguniense (strain DSM 13380 / JCM 10595 / TE7) TaxID=698757 RepID=H6QAW0_PYROT|nr:Fe-S oxidoreductase [Pyrobaculum oguniense TE7]